MAEVPNSQDLSIVKFIEMTSFCSCLFLALRQCILSAHGFFDCTYAVFDMLCSEFVDVDVERERRLAIFRPTFELLVSLVGYNIFSCTGSPASLSFCMWSFSISELLLLLHGIEL